MTITSRIRHIIKFLPTFSSHLRCVRKRVGLFINYQRAAFFLGLREWLASTSKPSLCSRRPETDGWVRENDKSTSRTDPYG